MVPALMSMLSLSKQAPVTVYVSPTGSDSAVGTERAPVQSLTQALILVRSLRKAVTDPATINLAAGDYPIRDWVRFTSQDSNLTVSGAAATRLFAGNKLTNWATVTDPAVLKRLPESSRSHVLFCDVSSDPILGQEKVGDPIANFDLVFDHNQMQLACWPKGPTFAHTETGQADGNSFEFSDPQPFQWTSGEDIWALGYWRFDYAQELNRVDLSKYGTVQLLGKANPGVVKGQRFYFLNVLEGLDTPGEFYFDRSSHRIYLYPPSDVAGREVFAEQLKTPILGTKDCSHLTFQNIGFEGGRNYVAKVDGGDHVLFQRCQIRNFGGSGITFLQSPNSGVSRCEISGFGSYCVSMNAGDRQNLTAGGDFADNNRIYNFGRWQRSFQPGIRIDGVGNRATHNEIHDAPHNAILLNGNDQDLEYNDIYRVCTEAGDAGAVYEGRDPTYRGLVIRFNRFHDIHAAPDRKAPFLDVSSVYLDDRLCGATVFGNIFEGPGRGVMVGGGRDNQIRNNIFVGKTTGVTVDQRGKAWAAGKPVEDFVAKVKEALGWGAAYSQHYPALAAILSDDPGVARNNDVSLNVFIGARDSYMSLENGLTLDQVGNQNNVMMVTGTLDDAIANEPTGFVPIVLKAIGPQPDN